MKPITPELLASVAKAVDSGIDDAIKAIYPDMDTKASQFDRKLLRAVYVIGMAHEGMALMDVIPPMFSAPLVTSLRQTARALGVIDKLAIYENGAFGHALAALNKTVPKAGPEIH